MGGEKIFSRPERAKTFSVAFSDRFSGPFSRFSNRFSCQIKNFSGAVSFCRRAALIKASQLHFRIFRVFVSAFSACSALLLCGIS